MLLLEAQSTPDSYGVWEDTYLFLGGFMSHCDIVGSIQQPEEGNEQGQYQRHERNPESLWCTEVFWFRSLWDTATKIDNLLIFFEVGETNKRQLISHKGLGCGECLYIAFVIFNLIKIAGVYVTAELWDHGGNRCQSSERQQEKNKSEQQRKKRKCCLIKSFSLINNLMLQLLFHRLLCLLFTSHKKGLTDAACWTVVTLTVSDCVEGPQVVFEERVSLDFLHTISTQPHVPWNTEAMLKSNSLWRAADCSWTCTQNLLCYESN